MSKNKPHWRWRLAQMAEGKWWQRYLRDKDPKVYLEWKTNYWEELLQITDPHFTIWQTDRILDLGCGPAGIFMMFPKNDVTAVDPLIYEYEEKLKIFSRAQYPNVRFLAQPMEYFETERPFNIVFCINAINHVKDLQQCYGVIDRSLASNGHLVLTIDAHNYSFFKFLFRLLPGDILHPHQYSLNEYQQQLGAMGMEIVVTVKLRRTFFFDHYLMVLRKIQK